LEAVEGWILDVYPGKDGEMVAWVKKDDGGTVRLTDRWRNAIYVSCSAPEGLGELAEWAGHQYLVHSCEYVLKRVNVFEYGKRQVLKLTLRDADRAERLAKEIEQLDSKHHFVIFNADLMPAQTYFFEKELFPLARVRAEQAGGHVRWTLLDSVMSEDYRIPPLRKASIQVRVNASGRIPKFSDPIDGITVKTTEGAVEISGGSERQKILSLVDYIARADPDIIFIEKGDDFTTHYLADRAWRNGIADRLILSRDRVPIRRLTKRGTSYMAYGRVLHTPTSHKLYGRINLDAENYFVFSECGLDGLFEIARLCRMPLHKGSRASIGKCLSSLQAYVAYKEDLLVPWKPNRAEIPKTAKTLLAGDRGGFIYEPKVGLHENVGEIDFTSLFPFIMTKYNISAETVLCSCCPDSKTRVPDVGYHTCEKRYGLIPKSLEPILTKRLSYKKKKKDTHDKELHKVYSSRVDALKGILVCCLIGDTPVLIERGGEIQHVKIGEFIDSLVGKSEGVFDCPPEVFVSGVDRNLHVKLCKIRKLIKLPRHNKILDITLETGRRITTTEDHPFFVLKNGDLETRTAQTIKEGDLIPVAKRLPFIPKQIDSIDLIDWLQSNLDEVEQLRWKVSGPVLKEAIATNRKLLTKMAIKAGYTPYVVAYWKRVGVIPLGFFPILNIPPASHKDLLVGIGRKQRKAGGRTSWLPSLIPVNEDLGFFLGLFVSDGSATNTYIRLDIAASQDDLLQDAEQVVRSLFRLSPRVYKEKKAEMNVLQINSLALVNFVERVLGLPGSAERGKLKVPSIIFNSNEPTAEGFLEGMIAGDGTVEKDRNLVSIGTADLRFANQLGYLAAMVDFGFRIDKHSRKPARPLYCVNFVGPETLSRIARWRFITNGHLSVLKPKLNGLCETDCSHPLYKMFPVKESGLLELATATRTTKPSRLHNKLSICPDRAAKAVVRIQKRGFDESLNEKSFNLNRLVASDLGFLRVKEVKELGRSDEFVYCFQIDDEDMPGFFAGDGAIYTHNCFGYLSYRNAKFGLIDCHISVCAYARQILLETARIAESRGFEVVHGIVDSLWVKKRGATRKDFEELCNEVKDGIGLPISFEGIYRWVAFLPSRMHEDVPVLNRYFGIFEDGSMKVRGIELRRRDSIKVVTDCQEELLQLLSRGRDLEETERLLSDAIQIVRKYVERIKNGDVSLTDLVILNALAKNHDQYESNLVQVSAIRQLAEEGLELMAGQSVSYVITNYHSKVQSERAKPVELMDGDTRYDRERYIELLLKGGASILQPFGVDELALKEIIVTPGECQTQLLPSSRTELSLQHQRGSVRTAGRD
jgi:DNA polymerase elongation subunit (family B)